MIGFNRGLLVLAAASACAVLLVACSSDPLTSSLRPTAEDKTASPNAPAGAYGALMRVGEATRQAGDPASAVPFFRRAHAAEMFKPEPLMRLGVALNDLGHYNEAAQAFRDALDLDHNNTEALRGLGASLIALNQPALAIDQFKAANAIEPDYRSFNGLGVASDHIGRHKQAQEYYEAGLKIYPNNLTLLNNLGLSELLSRDYDAAITTLVAAAQQPGATARQRQNLALAYGLGGHDADAERIARIDLSPAAVQSNLAYYGVLRAADDSALLAAVMGVRVPSTGEGAPGTGAVGAPADVVPQAGPAAPMPKRAPAPRASEPETGPSSSAAPALEPHAEAEPANKPLAKAESGAPKMATVRAAAGNRAGQTRNPQPASKAAANPRGLASVTPEAKPVHAERSDERHAQPDAAPPAARPAASTTREPEAPATASAQPSAGPAASPSAVPAAQPATGPSTALADNETRAEPPQTAMREAPSPPTAHPPEPAPEHAAIAASAEQVAAVPYDRRAARTPSAAPRGAPVWYAAALTSQPPAPEAPGPSLFRRIYDFFFKPMSEPGPRTAETRRADSHDLAAVAPAAGAGDAVSGASAAGVDQTYQSRRAAIPPPRGPPGGANSLPH